MDAIFKAEDLTICDVPVPSGYLQSQTHAGVAVWNGYIYLSTSPFPQVRHCRLVGHCRGLLHRISKGRLPFPHGENEENPMLYVAKNHDGLSIVFKPYIGNPVVNVPPPLFGYPAFNSDPDIYIENDILYLINRQYIRKTPPGSKHFTGDSLIRLDLLQFRINGDNLEYMKSHVFKETSEDNILSPCLLKISNKYRFIYLDTYSYLYPDGDCKMHMLSDNHIDGTYNEKQQIQIDSGDFIPWHLSVFTSKGKVYSVIACVKIGEPQRLYQMLGEFNDDMTSIKIYQKPLIDIPSYRGSAFVDDNNDFVLYSTTDRYKLRGSKSVDGKDVVAAKINFEKLLDIMHRSK